MMKKIVMMCVWLFLCNVHLIATTGAGCAAAGVSFNDEATKRLRRVFHRPRPQDLLGMREDDVFSKQLEIFAAVKEALADRANPNVVDCAGWTPLHWAAWFNINEAVKALLDAGANPHAIDTFGWTPICWAFYWDNEGMVEAFINKGVNPYLPTKYMYSPIELSSKQSTCGKVACVWLRWQWIHAVVGLKTGELRLDDNRSRDEQLFRRYVFIPDEENVNNFLAKGKTPNFIGGVGQDTLLHVALYISALNLLKALLDAGAHPDIQSRDGETPLFCAVWNGNEEGVKLLLEAGADPCIARDDGENPLLCAIRLGHDGIAELLRNYGAK